MVNLADKLKEKLSSFAKSPVGAYALGSILFSSIFPSVVNAVNIKENKVADEITYEVADVKDKDVYQSNKKGDKKAKAFVDWLIGEASNYTGGEILEPFQKGASDIIDNYSDITIYSDLSKGEVKFKVGNKGKTYSSLQFKEKPIQKEMNIDEMVNLLESDVVKDMQKPLAEEKKDYSVQNNVLDNAVNKIKQEQSKPKEEEVKINIKKEKKAKPAKPQKIKPSYDILPEQRQKEVAEIIDYVFKNENGIRKKYLFDDFESLTNKSVAGMNFSDLKKGLCPEARIFEVFADTGNAKAYIVDMCNEEWKSAVFYNTDKDEKIKSIGLLLEKDLNDKVFEYARDKRLLIEPIEKILNNISNLRRDNAKVMKSLWGKYKEKIIFLNVPDRKGISGVTYSVKKNLITNILEMDNDTFYRSSEPLMEVSLSNMSLGALLARDGRIKGTRGKANLIYDNNMLKQAQVTLTLTNNLKEQLVFGGSLFQDKIRNWSYTEGDAFFEYLKNNLAVKFLTGITNDKTDYATTSAGGLTLKQSRDGKSNPLFNASVLYTFPGQMPLIWGKPTIKARGASVSGNDSYNYEWINGNGLSIAQGSVIKPSDYTTAVLGLQNKWGFGKGKTANLTALVEAETNNFRNEQNGKMLDNAGNQTRIGLIGNYTGKIFEKAFNPYLAVIYQLNNNSDGTGKNNIASVMQIEGNPLNDVAVIANVYSEGLNGSNGASINAAYSPRAKKYLSHEGKLKKDIALYNIMNNSSLLPEVHPNVSNISPIYEGILASYCSGKDKQGASFCKAALDFYVGKDCALGAEYSTSNNNTKSMIKFKRAFR